MRMGLHTPRPGEKKSVKQIAALTQPLVGNWGWGDFLKCSILAPVQFTPAMTVTSRMVALTPALRTRACSCAKDCISHPKRKANQAAEVEKSYLAVISLPKQLPKATQLISMGSFYKSSSSHYMSENWILNTALYWGAGRICDGYGPQDHTDRAHRPRDKVAHGHGPWGHAGWVFNYLRDMIFAHIIHAAKRSGLSSITAGWGTVCKPQGAGGSGPSEAGQGVIPQLWPLTGGTSAGMHWRDENLGLYPYAMHGCTQMHCHGV